MTFPGRIVLLIVGMLALPALVHASEPSRPHVPGMKIKSGKEIATPKDPGMVVAPPKVDPDALKSPPKNIDPKIDDATRRIDRTTQIKPREKRIKPGSDSR